MQEIWKDIEGYEGLYQEWCEKISLSNKGKVSPNKGKKMSEEQKEKIRNSVKKNWELRKKGVIKWFILEWTLEKMVE